MKSKYKFIDEIKRKNITITNKEKVQNKQNKLNQFNFTIIDQQHDILNNNQKLGFFFF